MTLGGDDDAEQVTRVSPAVRHARAARDASLPDDPTRVSRRRTSPEDLIPKHPRYEVRRFLGAGGEGVVHCVHDRELGREVALKALRDDLLASDGPGGFLAEARAVASLEHPNILPIHDVGVLEDGRPFYTMRLVEGRSLANVLAATRAGAAGDEWSLVRIVQVIQQVCLGLQLAHERGVLHRDVKPSNILLGAHGEVLLVDWGIARAPTTGGSTESGLVKGTAPYMSPEQACGDALDCRTDVYSTGVVLYQVLAGRLPFQGASDAEIAAAILRDAPPRPDTITGVRAPRELSDLAMRAMSKDRRQRPPTAVQLHDELQSYVEGLRDRERRRLRAEGSCLRGDEALAQHAAAETDLVQAAAEVDRLESAHQAWEPIAEKQDLIAARRRLEAARERTEATFIAAVDAYSDALAHLPDHRRAREALADMHWQRFVAAEQAGDVSEARTCKAVVERFHDGRLARELQGDGLLNLVVTPSDATLELHPLVERDLVLVDGPGRLIGKGSAHLELPMGSYVVVATAPGHEPARYPVCIERNTHWKGELRLLPAGSLPEGFIYIPGAEVWLGGDAKATNGWPLRRVRVDSFAVARHPVTFGEYCEFLDALASSEPGSETAHVPTLEERTHLLVRGPYGYEPALETLLQALVEGAGPEEARRAPVCGVSRMDAESYVGWRAGKDGRAVRLPSAEEHEFSARGADRRVHAWGNTFDAALCHMRDSQQALPHLRQVGAAAFDGSVHGVRDLAGCIQEITGSSFDSAGRLVEVRGGSWNAGPVATRAAWRGACTPDVRNMQLGFRLALDVPPSS